MTQKKIPRYRVIANDLVNAIVSHKYPVGSALPPETELCAQLQASRHTIREALRILELNGLLARRQGSGSEVIADTPPVRYRQTVDTIEDLLQYGNASRLTLLTSEETPADATMAPALHCAVGAPCILLRALRSERRQGDGATGEPFALSHIYFPPQPARKRERLLNPATALSTLLTALDARTLGRIEQTFEASALEAEAAPLLHQKKGAPSLRVHRAYFDRKGALMLVAITWHRADMFRYTTVLRHEAA
jgi:DNA-binding GntR family transcriptional regulator